MRWTPTGRWALLKLLTGGLRVGVSARLAKQAPAGRIAAASTSPRVEEVWHGLSAALSTTCSPGWRAREQRPSPDARRRFRPVMLAQAIDEATDFAELDPADYAAEWKWDGIRVQAGADASGRRIALRLYSPHRRRYLGRAFPIVIDALAASTGVIDGELLVLRDGRVAPFGDLQQRLNRKTADRPSCSPNFPAGIRAYDLLRDGRRGPARASLRRAPRAAGGLRRARPTAPRIDLSPLQPFAIWDELAHCAPIRRTGDRGCWRAKA